jgi:hypothetical protein
MKTVIPKSNRLAELKSAVIKARASGLLFGKPTVAKPSTSAAELKGEKISGIRCEFIQVTPDIAQSWLKANHKNRALREDQVKTYARDMASDNWLITHQGIAFNDKDELIDGQHRLSALIRANKTVLMLVTFGLPSKLLGKKVTTRDAVDRGAIRTIADQLSLEHDLKDANNVTGVCAALARIWSSRRVRKISVSQTLEIFALYKESVTFVVNNRSKIGALKSKGVLGAVAFAHAVEKEKVEQLFRQLATGENLSGDNPILQLRNFLMSCQTAKMKGSTRTDVPEITLQAFFCAIVGKAAPEFRIGRAAREGFNYFCDRQKETAKKLSAVFELPPPR